MIQKYDSRSTLFYLDPPYFGTNNNGYKHENIDFEDLVKLLHGIKGKFILSINDDPYIRKLLKGFKTKRVKVIYNVDENDTERYELIVRNF